MLKKAAVVEIGRVFVTEARAACEDASYSYSDFVRVTQGYVRAMRARRLAPTIGLAIGKAQEKRYGYRKN